MTRVGRVTELDNYETRGLRGEAERKLKRRNTPYPHNRVVYLLDPARLDELGRWAVNNPPLVRRSGRLVLRQDEQPPLPDFRWTEFPGGIRRR